MQAHDRSVSAEPVDLQGADTQMESFRPGNSPNLQEASSSRPLPPNHARTSPMTTILIIILILLLIGGLPVFPHSRSWGYGPSGIVGAVLVVLLVLLLLGMI